MSSGLLTPSLVLASALVLGAADLHAQRTRLVRIAPQAARPAEKFEASEWSQRLAADDLAQRERAYGELSELARHDAAARDWVRDQARGNGELAWTCRLLQRELDQPRFGWRGGFGTRDDGQPDHDRTPFGFQPFDFGGDPFATQADLDALREHMQRMFDELRSRQRFGPLAQPGAPAAPAVPSLPGVQGSSRSLQLEQGPDGCKVTVEEDVDGKLEKKTYEARTLEELFDAHPELREKVGITIERPHGQPFAGRFDPAFRGWFQLDPSPFAPAISALRTDILGVVVSTLGDARAGELGLEDGQGLLVQRTEPGTIASVLGIGAGDVLAEINGRRIHTSDEIGAVLRGRKGGDEISVTWYDAGGNKRTRTWREGDAAKQADGGAAGRALNAPKQDV